MYLVRMRTAAATTTAFELLGYLIVLIALIGMFSTLTTSGDAACADSGPALDTILTHCELVTR
jgi:hypothetical protein